MKIKAAKRKDEGSCNLCSRGTLNDSGTWLHYPYEYVYTIESDRSGVKICICEDCLNEIKKIHSNCIMQPVISILICSLESRKHLYDVLIDELLRQRASNPEVEILASIDNKQHTTGWKRNDLLHSATGKYIIFIDDDDWIEPYYIEELLKAAESDADCFAINGWITTNGKNKMQWFLSKDNPNETKFKNGVPYYLRTTNHITGVKRELALKAGFPDKSNAEDRAYMLKLNPFLKTEYKIEKPLYHYRFSTLNKEYT